MNVEDKVKEDLKQAGVLLGEEHNDKLETPEDTTSGEVSLSTEGDVTSDSTDNELTPFEKEQQAKGWNPNGRKTAQEWADGEPLAKEVKQLKATIDQLKDHMSKQERAAYERAVQDLKAQRVDAIKQGNVELVGQIDEAEANLRAETTVAPQVHPAITDFYERNDAWVNGKGVTEIEMLAFAQERDALITKKQLPIEEHMQLLEDCVKEKFPEYFGIEKGSRNKAGQGVESNVAAARTGRSKTYSVQDLTEVQRRVGENFAACGVMTMDEYIKDLVKSGEIKSK